MDIVLLIGYLLSTDLKEKGRLETTWIVLRKFGYNNDIKLADELLPSSFKRVSDQVMFSWVKVQLL